MSPALTEPARSKEQVIIALAIDALEQIASERLTAVPPHHRARRALDRIEALRDIRAIVPEGK